VQSGGGLLDRWLTGVVSTPGLTAIADVVVARRVLLDDALRGLELAAATEGPIVDVGSGGGTPGIPIAVSLPDRDVTLLESERRKCEFLRQFEAALPNVSVVWGRAEEQAVDVFGLAVAKALARPPVAAELCLPLVRPGGTVLLWVGPSAERDRIGRVAEQLSAELVRSPQGLVVLRKTGPTPPGFPRRAGMAKKRPLA
jgi:16S rRNA (guanine(527)-N(7))-methyltransferase RsmG